MRGTGSGTTPTPESFTRGTVPHGAASCGRHHPVRSLVRLAEELEPRKHLLVNAATAWADPGSEVSDERIRWIADVVTHGYSRPPRGWGWTCSILVGS
jgi:hypothetical protein